MAGPVARTLTDWTKEIDGPDGKIAAIAELLKEDNLILEGMLWVEGNLADGHKTTVRSGLPEVTWRKPNHGVPLSKPRPEQITATCGSLETFAEIDKSLADLNGNTIEFRMQEHIPYLEAMGLKLSRTIFHGDTDKEPGALMGLAPHYSSKDAATTENATNVIDGGGTGDSNTSIWLVTWGPVTCHGIFPKGKISGLQHKDLGQVTLDDGDGGRYEGYRSHYKWEVGLCLRDWRYVVRIANISASTNLINAMIRTAHKLPSRGRGTAKGKSVFYCSPATYTWLDLQTLSHSNTVVRYRPDSHGQEFMTFQGIPVRECEAIVDNEKAI